MAAQVDLEKCDGSAACVDACPSEAIKVVDGKAQVDQDACCDCAACVDACPNQAISLQ